MQNLETLAELAKTLPEAVRANASELIEQMGATIEGIGDEDITWRPPYLRLVQGTTDRTSIPKGAAIGDFVLGDTKLENPLTFIPLRMWDSRQYWDPDQNSSKILCWSPDARMGSVYGECRTCKFSQWVEGESSACSKGKNLLAIDPNLDKVYTVTFSKTNYQTGMELFNALKKAAVQPYTRKYGLTNAPNSKAKNVENYKLVIPAEADRKTPAEFNPFLKEMFDRIVADRKAMLDAFYENAEKRKKALGAPEPQAAIEHDSGSKVVATETEDANVSPMAMSYTM